jgi:MOSC domain-containing protein YiiM
MAKPGEHEGSAEVGIVSVRVGRPQPLGPFTGADEVRSAIVKERVKAPRLVLGQINLEGDDQADRTVHGGVDKAVYAYSAAHFAAWSDELGHEAGPGTFGENLTVDGVSEDDVAIGDQWQWGDALLEVSQPRWPCFKLTIHTGVRDIAPRMRTTGRTGWYLRVLRPGTVPTSGTIQVVQRHVAGVTVTDAHLAAADRHRSNPQRLARVAAVAELAREWQEQIRH